MKLDTMYIIYIYLFLYFFLLHFYFYTFMAYMSKHAYIFQLIKRKSHSCVIKKKTSVAALTKRLAILQNEPGEQTHLSMAISYMNANSYLNQMTDSTNWNDR